MNQIYDKRLVTPRIVHARGILRCIAYDLNLMLDSHIKTENIYDALKKRVLRLHKGNKYQRIDWK